MQDFEYYGMMNGKQVNLIAVFDDMLDDNYVNVCLDVDGEQVLLTAGFLNEDEHNLISEYVPEEIMTDFDDWMRDAAVAYSLLNSTC